MHDKIIQILLSVILSACLLGCTGGNAISNVTPTETALPTSTRTVETVTPMPTPTLTPLPTLSPEDAIDFVETLIGTNGGCELPCWWGITPGVSTWNQARMYFAPFATNIEQNKPTRFLWIIHTQKFRMDGIDRFLL